MDVSATTRTPKPKHTACSAGSSRRRTEAFSAAVRPAKTLAGPTFAANRATPCGPCSCSASKRSARADVGRPPVWRSPDLDPRRPNSQIAKGLQPPTTAQFEATSPSATGAPRGARHVRFTRDPGRGGSSQGGRSQGWRGSINGDPTRRRPATPRRSRWSHVDRAIRARGNLTWGLELDRASELAVNLTWRADPTPPRRIVPKRPPPRTDAATSTPAIQGAAHQHPGVNAIC